MCGRFTLIRLSDFTDLFPWLNAAGVDWEARYNIAPSQPALVVTNGGHKQVELFQWGLVPFWTKDIAIGNKMINARGETLLDKPAFRTLLKRRRCIVPASGFYEWQKTDAKTKTPMYITPTDSAIFTLAGLWDIWRSPDGSELPTFTIITTSPNKLMQQVHDRMPVILDRSDVDRWLTPGELPDPPTDLVKPFAASRMQMHAVSRAVNSPASQGPHLIDVATPEPAEPSKKPPSPPPGLFDGME